MARRGGVIGRGKGETHPVFWKEGRAKYDEGPAWNGLWLFGLLSFGLRAVARGVLENCQPRIQPKSDPEMGQP